MKNITFLLRAIYPQIIMMMLTWVVFFYFGMKYPEPFKVFLVPFILVIQMILISIGKSRNVKLATMATSFLFIILIVYDPFFVSGLSLVLGIIFTVIFFQEAWRFKRKFDEIYDRIKDRMPGKVSIQTLDQILIKQSKSLSNRVVAKAAYLKRDEGTYKYAVKFYKEKIIRKPYNIIPYSDFKSWIKEITFLRTSGIIE